MRIASYKGQSGQPRSAVVVKGGGGDALIDLNDASGGRLPTGVLELLAGGDAALDEARRIASGGAGGSGGAQARPIGSVDLLAPIQRPGKLICVAGNFQKHIEEGGGQRVDKNVIVPKLFIKPSTSIIGPGDPLVLPPVAERSTDWELELAIVIGRRGRDIPYERALDYVAGYSIINDISGRSMDWNVEGRNPGGFDSFFDWLNGKWIDGFAAWGPWITTADEVRDPEALDMELKVNDKVWQKGLTGDMIFNAAEIISFASQYMTWEPGDIIAGGTLDGTGDASGVYLKAGDVMHGTIEGLGTLTTPVKGRTSPTGLQWRSRMAARA